MTDGLHVACRAVDVAVQPNAGVMRRREPPSGGVISVRGDVCPERLTSTGLRPWVATFAGWSTATGLTPKGGTSNGGSGDTGSLQNATAPDAAKPEGRNVVDDRPGNEGG